MAKIPTYRDEAEACAKAGLIYLQVLAAKTRAGCPTVKFLRCGTVDHPKSLNGFFRWYPDDSVCFGNHEEGQCFLSRFVPGWKRAGFKSQSRSPKIQWARLMADLDKKTKPVVDKRTRQAEALWNRLCICCNEADTNDYLDCKRIGSTSSLRICSLDQFKGGMGYIPKAPRKEDGIKAKLHFPCVFVPLVQGTSFKSFELIDSDGSKHLGWGLKASGAYWVSDLQFMLRPELVTKEMDLIVGEGVATVISALNFYARASSGGQAVGYASISAGNLPAVAGYLRRQYPDNHPKSYIRGTYQDP